MHSNKDDPIESAFKGITKGGLDWTLDKIKGLVKKFKDKNLSFIENRETIDIAKELRKKGEFEFFKHYVKNKDLHILFQMGLTLRELEKKGKDFKQLKSKIIKKYKKKGLHIAHFVQNGLFSKYVGNILDRVSPSQELKSEIEDLFENIDNTVIFIEEGNKIEQKAGVIVTKIQAHSPETFIISSVGKAMNVCEKVKEKVMQKVSQDYTSEQYTAEGAEGKKIYFLNRIEEVD